MNDPQEQNYSPAAKAALGKLLNRNKPEAKAAMTHNPNNLSDETVGVKYGWRLLDVDEVGVEYLTVVKEIQNWDKGAWEVRDCGMIGNLRFITYRTRLTRAELRAARGLPPEETAAVLTNEETTAFAVHEATESLRAEVARLEAVLTRANPPPERAYECLEMLEAADMGHGNHGNTLTGMVKEACEQLRKSSPRMEQCCECNTFVSDWVEASHKNGRICRPCETVITLRQHLREAQAANVVKDNAIERALAVFKSKCEGQHSWPKEELEKASSTTCGQPILNEIDALRRKLASKERTKMDTLIEKHDLDALEIAQLKKDILDVISELDAVKKERDELRLETARIAQDAITAFSDKIRKVETERDTVLRSLADANVRLDSYDEINAQLTQMHSEACDQRNEAQHALATSEAATAVLREALDGLKAAVFAAIAFCDMDHDLTDAETTNCKDEVRVRRRTLRHLQSAMKVCEALSTTPAIDLIADKARMDVIDSEGILIMSSSSTQFTVLTGDGESADGTTLRETIDKITAAKTP